MSTEIETPESMARRIRDDLTGRTFFGTAVASIRARDEQIATWCDAEVTAAEAVIRASSRRRGEGEKEIRAKAAGRGDLARSLAAYLRGTR